MWLTIVLTLFQHSFCTRPPGPGGSRYQVGVVEFCDILEFISPGPEYSLRVTGCETEDLSNLAQNFYQNFTVIVRAQKTAFGSSQSCSTKVYFLPQTLQRKNKCLKNVQVSDNSMCYSGYNKPQYFNCFSNLNSNSYYTSFK